jgi:cell wall assembly regulator SMI1
MNELLHRLKMVFNKLDPSLPGELNDEGITDEMITSLEQKIDHTLPLDFLEFYRLMNGEKNGGYVFDYEELLTFDRILDEWTVWKDLAEGEEFADDTSDPEAGIRNDWYNVNWIPFTYNGSGDHLCLDLDPAPGGKYGQVIRMWHDDAVRTLEYASFTEWLTAYIEDLKAGEFVFEDGYLKKKEDLYLKRQHLPQKNSLWNTMLKRLGLRQK